MAFARTKFGIEYNPNPLKESEAFPWAAAIGIALVLCLAVYTAVRIKRAFAGEGIEGTGNQELGASCAKATEDKTEVETGNGESLTPKPETREPRPETLNLHSSRPARVRLLLDKLAKAEEMRDTEMAIDTIEQIRAMPGAPAADLDDKLARRLGTLNLRKLFRNKSREWTKEITIKRGDTLERISREHGATAASTIKLNDGITKVKPGDKILVMHLPRFNLVMHSAAKYADLFFQGKFFKRYYLREQGTGNGEQGTALDAFSDSDRAELEMLLPPSATILQSEF